MPIIERCRPLLGTYVSVRVAGLAAAHAQAAIDAAFGEVALVHRLMSFHETTSDVSRLNREASYRSVEVHPYTRAVLIRARELAELSDGTFDITVAADLVRRGVLPSPGNAPMPHPQTSWRDIEIGAARVRCHRSLWLDLGGIAKGYAVDLAVDRLCAAGAVQVSVNAGGDLRVAGPEAERIRLCTDRNSGDDAAVIELANGSIASSTGRAASRRPHVDGRSRRSVGGTSFVSVVTEHCIVADGLTKIVLAMGARSEAVLRRYRATAYVQDCSGTWRQLALTAAAA